MLQEHDIIVYQMWGTTAQRAWRRLLGYLSQGVGQRTVDTNDRNNNELFHYQLSLFNIAFVFAVFFL